MGWKNSNSSPTHQSINLVGQLKILTVSTWLVKPVGKFNWLEFFLERLNEIISIKLDNSLLPLIKKGKKNFSFLLKIITNTTLFCY